MHPYQVRKSLCAYMSDMQASLSACGRVRPCVLWLQNPVSAGLHTPQHVPSVRITRMHLLVDDEDSSAHGSLHSRKNATGVNTMSSAVTLTSDCIRPCHTSPLTARDKLTMAIATKAVRACPPAPVPAFDMVVRNS